jgi:hypothetical protein
VVAAIVVSLAAAAWDEIPGLWNEGARPASFLRAELVRFAIAASALVLPVATLVALPLLWSGNDRLAAIRSPRSPPAPRAASTDGAVSDGGAGRPAVAIAGAATGAATGVLPSLWWLVPALGSRGTWTLLGLGLLLLASAVAWRRRHDPAAEPVGIWAASVTLAAVVVLLPDWNWLSLATHEPTAQRKPPEQPRTTLVAHEEDVAHGLVTTVRQRPSKKRRAAGVRAVSTVRHDGVVVVDDGRGPGLAARRAAVALAAASGRKRAFVAAPGPEPLARALGAAGFAIVDVAGPVSPDPSAGRRDRSPGAPSRAPSGATVRRSDDDLRGALAGARNDYDVVFIETPPLGHARTARLVDRELFSLVRRRLGDGGIVALSFPLARTDAPVVLDLLRVARAELSAVALYAVGGRGVLIGAARRADATTAAAVPSSLSVAAASSSSPSSLAGASAVSAGALTDDPQAWLVLSADDVDRALQGAPAPLVTGDRFGLRAARASFGARGTRATVDALLALAPTAAASRRARLDAAFPPRTKKKPSSSSASSSAAAP